MARKYTGARVWLDEKQDRFFIRDTVDGQTVKINLYFGKADPDHVAKKDAALAQYIMEKQAGSRQRLKNQETSSTLVADVITKYIDVRINNPTLYNYKAPPARVEELQDRLYILNEFFGATPLSDLSYEKVAGFVAFLDERTYQRKLKIAAAKYEKLKLRRSWTPENDTGPEEVKKVSNPKAAIRYIDDLNAAIAVAHKHNMVKNPIKVPSPADYERREFVLTRSQVAALIHAARRKRGLAFIDNKPVREAQIWMHLARFILIAIYSGSRKDKVFRVGYKRVPNGPWVDLRADGAILHRLGSKDTKYLTKVANTIPLPDRLAAHLRRWQKMGLRYPCQDLEGKCGDPSGALENLFNEVLGEDNEAVVHTFRHTAATWLVASSKLPLSAIAVYLGMSIETLVRRYAKVRDEELKKVALVLTQSIGNPKRDIDFTPSKPLTVIDRKGSEESVSKAA
ncbi:MAG: hypothetical protein ACK43M_11665 [Allorhizobium sp.]